MCTGFVYPFVPRKGAEADVFHTSAFLFVPAFGAKTDVLYAPVFFFCQLAAGGQEGAGGVPPGARVRGAGLWATSISKEISGTTKE